MKILVVDDDLELSNLIGYALRQAGYLVVHASDGREALAVFATENPDLVLLDANMPRVDGFGVLREIRGRGATTPVMMLTVRSAEEDQVRALDEGADDYLTKPFSPRTLLARVRALLRRGGLDRPAPLDAGDLSFDAEGRSVRIRGGEPVPLTNLESRLLQILIANRGHTLPVERLTSHVWGWRGTGDRQLLKQLVHRLRQKIERDPSSPEYVLTVPGVGYRLRGERSVADGPGIQ